MLGTIWILLGLSQVFVAVNGCLESRPQIRQVCRPGYLTVFIIHGLCHPDHISEGLSVVSAHIYFPFFGVFHGQAVRYLVSSYLDMRLYLNDRGVLLSLGACEQLLYDGSKETLMLVIFMCFWVLQVFVDAPHCKR